MSQSTMRLALAARTLLFQLGPDGSLLVGRKLWIKRAGRWRSASKATLCASLRGQWTSVSGEGDVRMAPASCRTTVVWTACARDAFTHEWIYLDSASAGKHLVAGVVTTFNQAFPEKGPVVLRIGIGCCAVTGAALYVHDVIVVSNPLECTPCLGSFHQRTTC